MGQKPATPAITIKTMAIIAGSTVIGILIAAILSNVIGGSIPWVPIGAGIGAASGVLLAFRLANQ